MNLLNAAISGWAVATNLWNLISNLQIILRIFESNLKYKVIPNHVDENSLLRPLQVVYQFLVMSTLKRACGWVDFVIISFS